MYIILKIKAYVQFLNKILFKKMIHTLYFLNNPINYFFLKSTFKYFIRFLDILFKLKNNYQ
jgi:hypothetical protein